MWASAVLRSRKSRMTCCSPWNLKLPWNAPDRLLFRGLYRRIDSESAVNHSSCGLLMHVSCHFILLGIVAPQILVSYNCTAHRWLNRWLRVRRQISEDKRIIETPACSCLPREQSWLYRRSEVTVMTVNIWFTRLLLLWRSMNFPNSTLISVEAVFSFFV